MRNIKTKLAELSVQADRTVKALANNPALFKKFLDEYRKEMPGDTPKKVLTQIQLENTGWREVGVIAEQGQTVVFPGEQANVFMSVIDKYDSPLDYKLPFFHTIIQFSEPVEVKIMDRRASETEFTTDHITALLLTQTEIDKDRVKHLRKEFDNDPFNLLYVPGEIEEGGNVLNGCIAIFTDWNHTRFSWKSDSHRELAKPDSEDSIGSKIDQEHVMLKRLAIACIGYINCENVYLHKEGETSEAVNAKRERKGKSRLEPYYVCRIRGVQYDSQGYEKGAGVKHGIRYDVRGHFRHLATGKTTWVRAHQRGLQNELYVPKTYLVDKRVS